MLRTGYFAWTERYGKANEHNALVPRDFSIEDWERQAILDFHDRNPLDGYRRLTFIPFGTDWGFPAWDHLRRSEHVDDRRNDPEFDDDGPLTDTERSWADEAFNDPEDLRNKPDLPDVAPEVAGSDLARELGIDDIGYPSAQSNADNGAMVSDPMNGAGGYSTEYSQPEGSWEDGTAPL